MKLNAQQYEAAVHKQGHAIVISGPGTGKTLTLTARHSFLKSTGCNSDEIMIVTFGRDAARELKNRLSKTITPNAWIGTFHSICLRILRQFHAEAGLKTSFEICDPSRQQEILQEIAPKWDNEAGELFDIICKWQDTLVTPDAALETATTLDIIAHQNAARHYAQYQKFIQREGLIDFAGLISGATELLLTSPKARLLFKSIKHVLIDEFQDVNLAQVNFLKAAADCGSNLWAVGDDDQCLYSWRGSDVQHTLDFADHFPNAKRYLLNYNYRSDPMVLKAANMVIDHNKNRIPKNSLAAKVRDDKHLIHIRGFPDETAEAEWISDRIKQFWKAGARLSEMVILMRTSSLVAPVQNALERAGIPHHIPSGNLWSGAECRQFLDILRAIEDNSYKSVARLRGARDLVETMKGAGPSETAHAVARILRDINVGSSSSEATMRWALNCDTIAEVAAKFETTSQFEAHTQEMLNKNSTDMSRGGIAMMTIHSAKGLEWRHVFVVGCESTMMPHVKSENQEEERRLFYVALTRTKSAIDLCFARERFSRPQTPSQYLVELNPTGNRSVMWYGGTAIQAQEEARAKKLRDNQQVSSGPAKIYRGVGGGRSLIPPAEEA